MTRLSALSDALEGVLDGSPWNSGDSPGLRAAADLVRKAVIDPEFLCECAELELQLLRNKGDGSNLVPFIRIPSIKAGLAFGYWAPFAATGPHEHTAWTITAVIRNRLDVCVYDWAKSYERGALIESRTVYAESPDVGHICSPTIHDVRNSTSRWSLALHVLSDHDGQRPPDYPDTIIDVSTKQLGDAPYRSVNAARMRRAKVIQMNGLLQSSIAHPDFVGAWLDELMEEPSSRTEAGLPPHKAAVAPLHRLRRIHPGLRLAVEQVNAQTRLSAYDADVAHPQLDVTADFAAPLRYIAEHMEFDVEALPGNLTHAERQAFARALEDSCLFEAI